MVTTKDIQNIFQMHRVTHDIDVARTVQLLDSNIPSVSRMHPATATVDENEIDAPQINSVRKKRKEKDQKKRIN